MKLCQVIKKGLGDKKEIFKAQVKIQSLNHKYLILLSTLTNAGCHKPECSLFENGCLELNGFDHDLIYLYYFSITPSIFSFE
jgi:hypothetical protein